MDNEFIVQGSPEILQQIKLNILYLDNNAVPIRTYYDKGEVHRYQGEAEGYVLYVSYKDELFFRIYCDLNPEYFDYSAKKSITIEQRGGKLYANIVFLKKQEPLEKQYDSSTQMLALKEAIIKYQDDFHPIVWKKQLSLEEKFRLTFLP